MSLCGTEWDIEVGCEQSHKRMHLCNYSINKLIADEIGPMCRKHNGACPIMCKLGYLGSSSGFLFPGCLMGAAFLCAMASVHHGFRAPWLPAIRSCFATNLKAKELDYPGAGMGETMSQHKFFLFSIVLPGLLSQQ
jgi:hypothetical protein